MARVAEGSYNPRVEANPAEQTVAQKLGLRRSDHQVLGQVFKYNFFLPLVPCFCKLIMR